jgi:hypothetical protein
MKIFNKVSVSAVAVLVTAFTFVIAGSLVACAAGPASVDLGSAGNFVILAKTGISTTGATKVVGDIAVSPAAATSITGFGLILPAASAFSTSALITGKVYAPGYANPTPAKVTTAIGDMQTAYTNGAGRTNPTATELGAGNIGGKTLAPGLYKWGTGVTIPTDVTLSGGANDVWIFQIAQTLTVSSGVKIVLSGGAQAGNIFWVVAGQTTIGTTAVFNGNILDQTAIVLKTGAKLNGRALAQSAVTLDASTVTIPAGGSSASVSAVPAIPATSAVPATPAVSANSSSGTGSSATPATPATSATHAVSANPAVPASSSSNSSSNNNGQQVRTIAISLGQGNSNNNVAILQQFLMSQNKGSAAQALAKVGATSYFGALTRAALAEFQSKVGISPALGNFGPITRGYLSTH